MKRGEGIGSQVRTYLERLHQQHPGMPAVRRAAVIRCRMAEIRTELQEIERREDNQDGAEVDAARCTELLDEWDILAEELDPVEQHAPGPGPCRHDGATARRHDVGSLANRTGVTIGPVTRTSSTPLYLGDELRARAEAAARARGLSLSAWVRDAITDRLAHDERLADGLAALAEWEAADGPIPAEVAEQTRAELEQAGVLSARRTA